MITADAVPTFSRKGAWAVAQYSSAGHLLSAPRSVMLMQRFEGLRGQRSSEQMLLQQQQAEEAEGEGGAAEPGASMLAADGTPLRKQGGGLLDGMGIPHVCSAPELQDASAPAVLEEGLAVEHRSDSGPPRGASLLRNAWLMPPEEPFQGSSHEGERRAGHGNPLEV